MIVIREHAASRHILNEDRVIEAIRAARARGQRSIPVTEPGPPEGATPRRATLHRENSKAEWPEGR